MKHQIIFKIIFGMVLINMLALTNTWAQIYVDQFTLTPTPVNFSGSNASKISATRIGDFGSCGELKISQTDSFSNGFQSVNYTFPQPLQIDDKQNAIIKIRLRTTAGNMNFRAAFRGVPPGGTSVVNLSCVWASKQATYNNSNNDWQELVFNYSGTDELKSNSGSDCTTNPAVGFPGAMLDGIAFSFNTGSATSNRFTPHPIYIDYISIGSVSPSSGNASCKTDQSSGSNPQAILVESFSPTASDIKAVTGTEISSGQITAVRAGGSEGANCGQLDVQNSSGDLVSNYSTINYDSSFILNNSSDAVIRIRAKVNNNGVSVPVRAIFRGKVGNGTVNLSNNWQREAKSLPGDGKWHTLTFYYGFDGDLNSAGATGTALGFPADIDGIGLAFYTGNTAVSSTISVDYIAVGNKPTISCVPASANKAQGISLVNIFPVPAKEYVQLSMKDNSTNVQVKLMNSTGALMGEYEINNGNLTINTSSLQQGLYLIGIYNEGALVSLEKIIIR
ncbi:MAG: T9SS type A sorting domain-containing protein [Cytophagaceae bacterium]